MANNNLLVKTFKGMEKSHIRLVLTKTIVREGLAPANCNDSGTIPSRFRICFDTEKLELHVKKMGGSLVTILEHWRLEGVVDHVAK